jgi:glycosyltransferase involved in cell wall biosynthesis
LAPSQWLANCAGKSILLQDKPIHVIANPVPNVYRNLKIHKNKGSKLKIGFFSQDLNNPYKGINTLLLAAHILKDVMQIELKLYGKGKVNQGTVVINYTKEHYDNDESAAEAYNSCDVVVVPSTQDNSPSVISEALMCGVPVIGSDIGGIPEILNEFDLPTIEPNNPKLLANKLIDFVTKKPNEDLISRANKLFSYKASSDSHLKIYEKALLNFKNNSVQ